MSALDEHVYNGRRDRLGRRVHAERGVSRHRDLLGIGLIGGGVAPAVPDRAVEHDPPMVPNAQLDRGMHTGPIPMACGPPDPVDGRTVDFGVVLFAGCRDGV
ncbi:Uncharacterised protein [Mycobacterium tuberculosis]|nr:Uncharacterised protein [Mycobacterium tuberculosis]